MSKISKVVLMVFGFLTLLAGSLTAQGFLPDAPVKKFELPYFEPQTNFLSMKLMGEEGLIRADGTVGIQQMTIHFFSPERGQTPHTIIRSPQANLFPSKYQANGTGELDVIADQFSLKGKDWEWHWKQNRLHIRQGVQLTLKQELGPILQ